MDDREIASQLFAHDQRAAGGDLAAVERVQEEELKKFIASGPTPEELDRIKTQKRAAFIRGIERIGGFGGKSDILARGWSTGAIPKPTRPSRGASHPRRPRIFARQCSDG
jgi:hypothetical protein